MKHWWITYILTLCGVLLLVALAFWVRIFVLHEESADLGEERLYVVIGLTLFAVPGAHCVAMFASRPSWRRRALYVTRVPWSAGQAALFFVVLLLGPEMAVGALVGLGEETAGQEPALSNSAAEGQGPSTVHAGEADGSSDETEVEDAQPDWQESELESYGRLAKPFVSVGILLVIAGVMRSRGLNVWRGLGFGGGRLWRHIGIGVVAYVAFTWAVLPVLETGFEALFNLFGREVEPHEAIQQYKETESALVRAGLLVSIMLAAPFFEEVIFRGVLLQTIKRYAGSAVAIVASALIFAALHGTLYVGVNIFCLGLLFGYLFDKTGSIVPGMVLHFLFNGTSTVFLVLGV